MKTIRLAPVDLHSIRLDIPLPFDLVDSHGVLLAQKGFVFRNESTLNGLAERGRGFFVDFSDLSNPRLRVAQRDYVNQLIYRLESQGTLGDLAKVHLKYSNSSNSEDVDTKLLDWPNIVERCNSMLHTRDSKFFYQRLESMVAILTHEVNANPDKTLLALFYLSQEQQPHLYSTTHSILVCAICALTASTVLHWSDADVNLLMRCALTMNIGMVDLQDALTFQKNATDLSQRVLINEHAAMSGHLLEMFGVDDNDWLNIVRSHHGTIKDPIRCKHRSERLVGLLHRVDVFTAKLSSRLSRISQPSYQAMKSVYFDEFEKIDVMGAAILKAVGVYRPGSFVKLASGEIAVVIRRGKNTSAPTTVIILNKNGIPVASDIVRETSDKNFAITSVVPSNEIRVTLNLDKLLKI
jgi:HD-GYP domain-containing protein (c-di-GMP phosphodiesterase class II)